MHGLFFPPTMSFSNNSLGETVNPPANLAQ